MTISSTSRKAGPYAGNGVTVSFPFSFKVFSTSDLLVTEIDSDDNEETLALTTNYTVALNADQNATPGGTITLPDALPVGNSLTIRTNIPITQTMDLTNQGGFYPTVINNAMDRATIQIQQLAEIVGRSPAVSIGSGLSGITIESPGAGEYLRWNLAGTAIEATAAVYDLGTFMQSGTGAVERSAMSKMGERVSVKDFGAVGDNAADDTAAIQAAIDYAETLVLQQFQSGATVFFPAGTYKITSGLTVAKDNVGLAGDSVAASVITAVSPTFDLITFSKGGGTAIYRAAVRDLRLLATGNASAGSLLKLDTVYHSTVDNISLDGGYIGLTCDGCGKLIVNNLDTHQTSRSTGTPSHAVNLASTLARNSDVHFTNFQFYFQTGSTPNYAMNIDGADGIYLTSGHMHGGVSFTPSNSGVEVTCASVFFDNVYFDRSPQHHVYLTGAASNAYRNIRFVNCTFRDANRGIYQDSTTTLERLLVSACAFYTHAHSAIQLTTSDPVGAVITGCQFGENSSPTAMVQLNGSNHIISDSAFNGGSGSSGVLFGASCSNSIIADCNFAGCTATVPITNSGTGNVDKSTYAAGTYTATALGVSGTVNGTVGYAKDGNRVTLDFPTISGTSDATTFSLTGGPNAIKPLANRFVIVRAQDNGGAYVPAVAQVGTNGVVTIYANLSGGTFTASGTKSIGAGSVSYLL